jgi:hypothetical protein
MNVPGVDSAGSVFCIPDDYLLILRPWENAF